MRILPVYIVSYIVLPVYGVAAHPGLAVGFVASLGASGLFVIVPVVIIAIGLPVGIALFEHYRLNHRPRPRPNPHHPEPRNRRNIPIIDTNSDAADGSEPIRIPNADVPDNTRLVPFAEAAEGRASPTTAAPSDPFSNSVRSETSSITSRYTESTRDAERRTKRGAKTDGDKSRSGSKPPMEDDLRGTDGRCEQAKGPIQSQIDFHRPPVHRSFSDDISFGVIAQLTSLYAGSVRGSPRSSTESSESSEASNPNKSESSNAEESPEGSGILQIISVKSFSDDERAMNQAVRQKQDQELRRRLVDVVSSFSAEPEPLNPDVRPEIEKVIKDLQEVGLDDEGAQAASTQVAA